MKWKTTITVLLTISMIAIAGCSTSNNKSDSELPTSVEKQTTDVTVENSEKREHNITETTTEVQPNGTSRNKSIGYSLRFKKLIKNDSLHISRLDNPYNGTAYNGVNINVTNFEVKSLPPDDQNIIVVSQSYKNISVDKYQASLAKISIVFSTLLKREALNDGKQWNVSQIRVLTYQKKKLKLKNRIEFDSAGNWVFQLLNWTAAGYINNRIIPTSDIYRPKKGGFTETHAKSLENRLQKQSVGTNISQFHVNQSGKAIFLTYTSVTPPSDNQMSRKFNEYDDILTSYGYVDTNVDHQLYNYTTLYIEEVYAAPNGTYDTRRVYRVNSTFARKVYNGEVTKREISKYLINRAVFEDDAYDE